LRDIAIDKPLPVLRECGRMPDLIIHAQPDKPSKEYVVLELLDQHPLTVDTIEHLQQERSQQSFRWHGSSAAIGIQPTKIADISRKIVFTIALIGRNGSSAGCAPHPKRNSTCVSFVRIQT